MKVTPTERGFESCFLVSSYVGCSFSNMNSERASPALVPWGSYIEGNKMQLPKQCFSFPPHISVWVFPGSRALSMFRWALATMVILWKSEQSLQCSLALSSLQIAPWVITSAHPVSGSLKAGLVALFCLHGKWRSSFRLDSVSKLLPFVKS